MNSLIPSVFSTPKSSWNLPLAAILCLTLSNARVHAGLAQPFAPGDIVIERSGDGSGNLNATAAPIYFDEMTTNGVLVQSIEVTSNGPSAMVDVGNTGGDISGGMTLAANGAFVVFPGYNTNSGTTGLSAFSSAAVPRAVGKIDANGNYTLAASTIVGFNTSTIRGAVSDGGTNFWASGTSGNTSGGIQYLGTASPVQVYTNGLNANLRMAGVFNGSIWFGTASSTALGYGIYKFVDGFPITISQPTKVITLVAPYGTQNFSVSPDGNTIYVADDGDENATNAGIHKFTFNGSVWSQPYLLISNTPCFGIVVNWQTTPVTIYATTANFASSPTNNSFITLQDNGITSTAATLATVNKQEAYRGLSYVPTNATVVTQAPSITSIYPPSQSVAAGGTATITLFGNTGNPIGSNFWYQIVGNTTNVVSTQPGGVLTFPNATPAESGNYFAVITNVYGSATSSVVSVQITAVPTISSISPSGTTMVNVGSTVTFTLTDNPGNPVASNFWYQIVGGVTTLVPGASGTTLTLTNVLGTSDGSYFAVLTNVFGSATSSVATLIVTNDPEIRVQPASTFGLLDGQAQFSVTAFGSSPIGYQWWYADASGNLISLVNDGHDFGDQEIVSGSKTSLLTISNLINGDLRNFVVVVTNAYGSATSSVATLEGVNVTGSVLAFWYFNGAGFTNTTINPNSVSAPTPWLGVGSAGAVGTCSLPGTSPFLATTTADGSGVGNGLSFFGVSAPPPGFSWGVGLGGLPLSANISTNIANSNKLSGVQFNVSTVGAKNIKFGFDARATQTASEYERLQYTTNGTTWIDYPVATSFNDIGGSGATGWESYPNEDYQNFLPYDDYTDPLSTYYDLTGFPGVANNPNFGLRIVVEYENTATYGVGTTNDYAGVGETYATGGDMGTYTYDLVGVYGDAITNNNVAPVISAFYTNSIAVTNETVLDSDTITNTFTVSGDTTADKFTYSAVSLNGTISANFSFTSNANGNCTLVIAPNPIADNVDAAPILVTVTDTNGDSSSAWFNLTVTTEFPSPVVTRLVATNTLANTTLKASFTVSSTVDPVSQFTYTTSSGNSTVIPAGGVTVSTSGGGATAANPILNVTPANNELGVGLITVNVNDMDSSEQKITSVSIPVMVAPNTNILALDYFNYDGGMGALDTLAGVFWQHLSGHVHQMVVTPAATGGSVLVDTFNNTENVQTPLLGAPYSTNANAVVKTLYYSFVVNMNANDMPLVNGTYFAAFNDGQNITADVDDCLVAATNGAAPGYYRLGISDDVGATSASGNTVMFPQDLSPGTNYVVVTALNLSTGQSTLWVNPGNDSSPNVTAGTDNATVAYPISDFELRESGGSAGGVNVSFVKVGKTFDSVFPSLQVQSTGGNVIVNWSDPTLGIQSSPSVLGPFTDVPSATPPYTNNVNSAELFYRFGH